MRQENIFWQLSLIDFESGVIDYEDLKKRYFAIFKESPLENKEEFTKLKSEEWGSLVRFWWKTWRIFPHRLNIDLWLSLYLGEHLKIGNLLFFGYNAMFWAIEWKAKTGYWIFQPPCFGKRLKFTLGYLYFSPDGTRSHRETKIFWQTGYL